MRNRRVRSQSGASASFDTRSPDRSMRRHSTYVPSTARSAAIRSAVWPGTPQCLHQDWITAADGTERPCSIRDTLEPCRPISRPSSRAVSPASIRSSRRRVARFWRPDRTLDDGEDTSRSRRTVVFVRDGPLPHRLERRGAKLHHGQIGRSLMCGRFALAGEVVDQHDPSIEKPEVVARKGQVRGSAAWQPTHLLATDDVHEGAVVFISNVLTERLGHDSCAPDLDTPARHVGCRLIPGVPPGLPVRRIPTLPVAPCEEVRVAAHVAVAHLEMYGG